MKTIRYTTFYSRNWNKIKSKSSCWKRDRYSSGMLYLSCQGAWREDFAYAELGSRHHVISSRY